MQESIPVMTADERRQPGVDRLPIVYLARHGETAWSRSGQFTGLTDLALTVNGERDARRLGVRLAAMHFELVLTSGLQRADRTSELAGFHLRAEVEPNLVEWDYGVFEGRHSAEIRAANPDWELFRDGGPGGESPDQVRIRADKVIARVRACKGDALLFSSGHILRAFAARWLGQDVGQGKYLLLNTASLSALSYDHQLIRPAILFWNDTSHVSP